MLLTHTVPSHGHTRNNIACAIVFQTTTEVFEEKYQCYLKEFQNNPQTAHWTNNDSVAHAYVSFTYDGVWAMAFALDKTRQELLDSNSSLTLGDFKYFNRTPTLTEAIERHMMQTNFTGVSVSE